MIREKLDNAPRRSYDYVSRYGLVPVYNNLSDHRQVTGLSVPLQPDTPYIGYEVKEGDSYDSIALTHYNNPTLYWVITEANGVADPFSFPEPGSRIRVPVLSSIEFKPQGLR